MENLKKQYDKLQLKYGSKNLNSVYGCGCENSPEVALVFMNPTKRNVATNQNWKGLRAQWLGTKQIWDFLTKCNLFDEKLNKEIQQKKPADWTYEFCEKVYDNVKQNKLYITNLAKCTQEDARPLPNNVFYEYRNLLVKELCLINPKKIFLFGNQVASIVLEENISVSQTRQKQFVKNFNNKNFKCYAIYYPVGNGRFNQNKAIEDIKNILIIN